MVPFGSILGLGAPPPLAPSSVTAIKPVLGQTRAFVPRLEDALGYQLDRIRADDLRAAYRAAELGFMKRVADINDLILTHPVLGGIVEQRVAGVKDVTFEWQPGNDSARAAAIFELTKAEIPEASSAVTRFQETSVMQRLRGGGLAENVWAYEGYWRWKGAVTVPQQRMRFSTYTREPAFAFSPWDYQGVPLSAFDPGTFALFLVHEDLPNFGHRGYLRRLSPDWFAWVQVSGQWGHTVERWADPPLHLQSNHEAEKTEESLEAMRQLGPGAVVPTALESKLTPLVANTASRGTNGVPHHEFEDSRERRAQICLLGFAQAAGVQGGDGSQNSSDNGMDVRDDILKADAEAFAEALSIGVAAPLAVLNYGPDAAVDAARMLPKFEQPIDVGAEIANVDAADALGLEIAIDEVYSRIRMQRPGKGVETLRQFRKANGIEAPGRSNVLAFPAAKPAPKGKGA